MADIRINSLPSTATSFNTDDYIPIDGASGGTRKMLAATLPLTDVKFGGASGPSAKSSIAARAARQGVSQDGTNGVSVSAPALGTADFSISFFVRRDSSSIQQYLIGNDNLGCLYVGFRTSGALYSGKAGGSANADLNIGNVVGKWQHIVLVRSGGNITGYADGVSVGSVTDAGSNYTAGAYSLFQASAGVAAFVGAALSPYFYNRALTAAEVVNLYESGVPSGADYNNASNTSIITGANSDFSSDTGYWTKTGTASIGSGVCTLPAVSTIFRSGLCTAGKRYRITITLSGGSVTISNADIVTYGTISGAGTGSLEFTASTTSAVQIINYSGTITIDNVLLVPVGLLLAPDAAQAGGGLTWYDTSGNAANITLPASGVSWNVPTSGKMATSLTIGGTGVGLTLAPSSGAASMTLNGPAAGSAVNFALTGTNKYTAEYVNGSDFFAIGRSAVAYDLVLKSGNVLVGTTIDGGQKLQVAGAIAATTGAANNALVARYNSSNSLFGVTVNSAGQGVVSENNDASTGSDKYSKTGLPAFRLGNTGGSGTVPFWVDVAASGTAGNAITWTNAFQIDASKNATFGGNLTVSGGAITIADSSGSFGVLNGSYNAGNQFVRLNRVGGTENIGLFADNSTRFTNNSAETVRIFSNGNVFIGASPVDNGAKLQVSGSFTCTGFASLASNVFGAGTPSGATPDYGVQVVGGNPRRMLFSDGTGYSLSFSKRSGSVNTDLLTISDSGITTINRDGYQLELKSITGGNARAIRLIEPANTKYNWQVGAQINNDNYFEVTPSSAVGGSTFSGPAFQIAGGTYSGAGLSLAPSGATFATNLNVNGSKFEMTANGAYAQLTGTGTGQKFFRAQNTGGDVYFGVESATAGSFFPGSAAYNSVWYSPNNDSFFKTPNATFTGTIATGGSSNSAYLSINTNQSYNTAGPVTVTVPDNTGGFVTVVGWQSGVGKSSWTIPYVKHAGTIVLGTAIKSIITADPITGAAASSGNISLTLFAANTNIKWGINSTPF